MTERLRTVRETDTAYEGLLRLLPRFGAPKVSARATQPPPGGFNTGKTPSPPSPGVGTALTTRIWRVFRTTYTAAAVLGSTFSMGTDAGTGDSFSYDTARAEQEIEVKVNGRVIDYGTSGNQERWEATSTTTITLANRAILADVGSSTGYRGTEVSIRRIS